MTSTTEQPNSTAAEFPAVAPEITGTAPSPEELKAAKEPKAPLGRRFTTMLVGAGLTNTADGILMVGVPLIAAMLTRSPQQISLIAAATWIPWLLLAAVTGVVVDRVDRRKLQMLAIGVKVLVLGTLSGLALTDNLTIAVLIIGVFMTSTTEVFADLSQSSIVPMVAPRERLAAANGRMQAVMQVCNGFIGAPIAAAMLVWGAGALFGVAGALCVAFLFVIGLGLKGNFRATVTVVDATGPDGEREEPVAHLAPAGEAVRDFFREVRGGLVTVGRHPVLRIIVMSAGVMNMLSTAFFSVFVLWVVGEDSRMGLEQHHFAMALMALPVGAVVASVFAERLSERFPPARVMWTGWTANGAMLFLPVLWPTLTGLMVTAFFLGVTNTIGNVTNSTQRQRMVPVRALGKVGGAGSTLAYGLMPVGALIGGWVGENFGLQPLFLGIAVLYTGLSLIAMRLVTQEKIEEAVRNQDKYFPATAD